MKIPTRTGAVVLFIIAATFLVYWPALRNGFVWDDTALVLRDPLIRSWRLVPEGFRHFLFLDATASNFYRPLQRLTFVGDYQLYGFDRPWGWHLTSILIHAAAAVAVFLVGQDLLALAGGSVEERWRFRIAFFVALVWAIHPLQTSAVTYIAGRADPLAALFGFTGLALALRGRRTASEDPARHVGGADFGGADSRDSPAAAGSDSDRAETPSIPRRSFRSANLGAALCFFLAMLSKESGILFLPVWLCFLAWHRESRRALVPWLGLGLSIVAAYSLLRQTAERVPPPCSAPTPVAIRPILAARALAGYAGLLVAPLTLRMERDVTTHPLETVEPTLRRAGALEYQSLAGVLLFIGLVAWMRFCLRRDSVAALCLAAFALTYLPISNVFSLNATIAEHWLYVPGAFLFLAVGLALHQFFQRRSVPLSPFLARGLGGIGLAWMLFLGVRTFLRQADWRDQRTFIERTIAAGGDSPRMLMNLGNVEFAAGHQEAALVRYREALRSAPDQPLISLSYASVLLRARDYAGARESLVRAEKSPFLGPDCLALRASLENAETGRDPGDLLRQAVAAAPDEWALRKRYLEYLHARSGPAEALRDLHTFLQRHPFRAESWRLFATLLEEQHQPVLAREAWREAALRDVRDAVSRAALGRLGDSTP